MSCGAHKNLSMDGQMDARLTAIKNTSNYKIINPSTHSLVVQPQNKLADQNIY